MNNLMPLIEDDTPPSPIKNSPNEPPLPAALTAVNNASQDDILIASDNEAYNKGYFSDEIPQVMSAENISNNKQSFQPPPRYQDANDANYASDSSSSSSTDLHSSLPANILKQSAAAELEAEAEQRQLEASREQQIQKLALQKQLSLHDQGVNESVMCGSTLPTSPISPTAREPESGVTVDSQQENSLPAAETNGPASPRKHLKVGDSVTLGENKFGQVRFYGSTQFADGVWVGLALSVPEGKNDGSVSGVQYFNCPPNHGLFIRAEKLEHTTNV